MKFNELSNEEIVFTSILLKDMTSAYYDVLEAGGLEHVMDSPLGKVHIFKELTSEEKDQLQTSDKLRILRSIIDKLDPIVELILDSEPAMENELEEIIFGTEDGEEAEDM
jgi:hypothetical protein